MSINKAFYTNLVSIESFTVFHYLTLILPTSKVISLCHQYWARPACTSMQSDQDLYYWPTQLQVFILISLKMIMHSAKNGRWIMPFKKFGMIRVNVYLYFIWKGVKLFYYGNLFVIICD